MSELANLLKDVRGKDTQAEMAKKCQVGLATIGKLMALGRSPSATNIRLSTIRKISKAYRLPTAKHLELIRAWLRLQLGPDLPHFEIHVRSNEAKDALPSIPVQISSLVVDFPPHEQKALLTACKSPELRKAITAMAAYAKA